MRIKVSRSLRHHQRIALRQTRCSHPALFMDMRLGKTLICIRRILTYRPRSPAKGLRTLIVAPNSALGSWEDELTDEGISWLRLAGSKKHRLKLLAEAEAKEHAESLFVLTNRESWISIGAQLTQTLWDAVVLDESHFIKNPRAKVTKFCVKYFRDVPHRWVLTGTPRPESDEEWFCQFQFLRDRFMGCDSFWQWRQRYFYPHPQGYGWLPKKDARKRILSEVSQHAVVMRRSDVGMDVPRVTQRRVIELPAKVRKAYRRLEDEFILELDGEEIRDTIWTGAKFALLRQMCSGRLTDGTDIHSGKRMELHELLSNELRGVPVVIWCVFKQEIQDVLAVLKQIGVSAHYIDGSVKSEVREKRRRDFQSGKVTAFIAQFQTAEAGMNLSRSDTNIYYSEPPGYLAWSQTRDRILDVGRKTPLLDISLVVEKSVDEDLHKALKAKSLNVSASFNEILKAQMMERRE